MSLVQIFTALKQRKGENMFVSRKVNFKIANVFLNYKGHIHMLTIINPDIQSRISKNPLDHTSRF